MNLYAYLDGAQTNHLQLNEHINVPDMESAYKLSGLQFRRVLVDVRISDDVRKYLHALNKWIPTTKE